jgi:hypothetical protein
MHTPANLLAALALAATATAKTIVITAGSGGGLVFSPDSPTADMGDILEFHFASSIHTAVQGDFSTPCSMGSLSSTGFDSGSVSSVCLSPFQPSLPFHLSFFPTKIYAKFTDRTKTSPTSSA